MATQNPLFTPLSIGTIGNNMHRVALAPLTRMRADEPGLTPRKMHIDYYSQRASPGGLLISEATFISPESHGYNHAPGIWTEAQIDAWKKVTDAVHMKGGKITCQLWHIGRISHKSWINHPLVSAYKDIWQPGVSASAIPIGGGKSRDFETGERVDASVPRPLRTDEMPRLVNDYVHAAECAMRAGFDGVEVHAAHGYLIDQFLNSGSNQRTDKYGGSIENRCRLLFEVLDAVSKAVGPGKCAVRLSPHAPGTKTYSDCTDPNPDALYEYAIKGINQFPLAYLLLTEPRWDSSRDDMVENDPGFNMPVVNGPKFRQHYQGTLILAGGFTPKSAQEAVESGMCDAIAFGRWFISNPDLPARLKNGIPLNRYNRKTFYAYSNVGYTDYPTAEEVGMGETKYTQIEQDKIGKSLASAKL
jgi:N-ethylmaleimide reductase|eukprot:g8234.t1